MTETQKHFKWLHDLTVLGYNENILITTDLDEKVEELYNFGYYPATALKKIVEWAKAENITLQKPKQL